MQKILIADDHPLFRDAITNVLQTRFNDIQTLTTEDLDSALEIVDDNSDLDLILLDLNMPGMDGLNGIVKLRNSHPDIPVVIVSAEENKSTVLQAMTYGAVGFITKSSTSQEIADALQQIMNGQVYLPPDVIRSTHSEPQKKENKEAQVDPKLIASLSRRQLLVFERMAKGESNKKIAYELNIAETTVKSHVSAILHRLKVHNRIQAVLCASNIDFKDYIRN